MTNIDREIIVKPSRDIIESHIVYSIDEAFSILESRKGKYCLSAERKGDSIMIHWAKIRCPHCGKLVPFIDSEKSTIPSYERLYKVFGKQESMFSQNEKVIFNPELADYNDFICSNCNERIKSYDDEVTLNVHESDTSISVCCKVGLYEVYSCDWIDSNNVSVDDPDNIKECITFNLESGATYLSMVVSDYIPLGNRNITTEKSFFSGDGKLCKLFVDYWKIRSTVKKLLEEKYNAIFPFEEVTLPYLMVMNLYYSYQSDIKSKITFDFAKSIYGVEFIKLNSHREYLRAFSDVEGDADNYVDAVLAYERIIGVYKYDRYIALVFINDNQVEKMTISSNLVNCERETIIRAFRIWLEQCRLSTSMLYIE